MEFFRGVRDLVVFYFNEEKELTEWNRVEGKRHEHYSILEVFDLKNKMYYKIDNSLLFDSNERKNKVIIRPFSEFIEKKLECVCKKIDKGNSIDGGWITALINVGFDASFVKVNYNVKKGISITFRNHLFTKNEKKFEWNKLKGDDKSE